MSLGTGVALFVIGAILAFALNIQVDVIDLRLVGYILMGAGAVVFVVVFAVRTSRTDELRTAPRYQQCDTADDHKSICGGTGCRACAVAISTPLLTHPLTDQLTNSPTPRA